MFCIKGIARHKSAFELRCRRGLKDIAASLLDQPTRSLDKNYKFRPLRWTLFRVTQCPQLQITNAKRLTDMSIIIQTRLRPEMLLNWAPRAKPVGMRSSQAARTGKEPHEKQAT
jgi:hypothetical protein